MTLTIRHLTGSLGIVPTDLASQPCSGLVGAALGIAEAQVRQGHRAQVIGWNPDATAQPREHHGVTIRSTAGWGWAELGPYDFRVVAPIIRLARQVAPADVAHAYADPHLLLAPGARRRVLHLQTPTPDRPGRTYVHLLRRADAVVCCSEFIRRQFLERVPFPEARVAVVHNGFDPTRFDGLDTTAQRQRWHLPPETPIILFAGALVPEKGLVHLLRAARRLTETHAFEIVVAGSAGLWLTPDGDQPEAENEYTRLVRETAVDLPVRWLGAIPAADMPSLYAAADIFVCPSTWDEPFGMVACEAMAAGKPVVASRAGGLPEIVADNVTGLLVPPGDENALAESLAALLPDPDRIRQMGERARARSAMFSWANAASTLDDIYARLEPDSSYRAAVKRPHA